MFTDRLYINRVIIITYSFQFINEGKIIVFRVKSGIESVQIITKFFSIGTIYILEKDLGFVLYPVIACRPFQACQEFPSEKFASSLRL